MGINNPATIHYQPKDGYFGDPIPFCHDHVYHVFYDKLQKNHKVCWAHLVSGDLIHWEELPDALPNGTFGSYDEQACITGSIIEHKGVYHAFYTGIDRQGTPHICHAGSLDLICWQKDENPVLDDSADWYRKDGTWRDPCVFYNPDEDCFWMVFCTRIQGDGLNTWNGALGLAVSRDLMTWTIQPPIWTPNLSTVVECPDLFQYQDHWIMLYFWHETRYRISHSPAGPWQRPFIQAPDSFDFFAGKTMADNQRRILIGWIPRRICDCHERTWGGVMAIPREFYLLADGTPATRCAAGIVEALTIDATDNLQARVFQPVTGKWTIGSHMIAGNLGNSCGLVFWPTAPDDYYLETVLSFQSRLASVSFMIRTNPDVDAMGNFASKTDLGYQLILDAADQMIYLREIYQWDQRSNIVAVPYQFAAQETHLCQLFVHQDILEFFIGEKQSIVTRLLKYPSGGLGLSIQNGDVLFSDLLIRKIQANTILSEEDSL